MGLAGADSRDLRTAILDVIASNPPIPSLVVVGKASGVDDTTLINNAIAQAMTTQSSGSVLLTDVTTPYVCLSALVIPYTGPSNAPVQTTLRIYGIAGPTYNGYWAASPINGGVILDLRYAGGDGTHVAKIDTRGAGTLEIDHLTIKSGGSDNYQIMQTTNTTVKLHDLGIIGNAANSGASCTQDFLLCGGSTNTVGNGSTAPFQGYGSKIHDNYYSHIQRGVIFGTYCNGIEVENETYSSNCGSSLAQGAPYYFAPMATQVNQGNRIRGGTIEVTHYKYVVAMMNDCRYNIFDGVGAYDNVDTVGGIYCAVTCVSNLQIAGELDSTLFAKYFDGPGAAFNTLIAAQTASIFQQGITATPFVEVATAGIVRGNGLVLSTVTAATPSGSAMTIDTGTGGSYLDLKAFGFRFNDYNGVNPIKIFPAAAGKIVPPATSISLRNNADNADNLLITDAGNVTTRGTLNIGSRPAFAASDKYLVVDASGNVHVSALGPAS